MASTSSFPSLVSGKTPFAIVLADTVAFRPPWLNCISSYIGTLVKRVEEIYQHPLAPVELVAYGHVHSALINPVYPVVGHDGERVIVTNRVIKEDTPDVAAFYGYTSVFQIIDDLQTRYPNEEFSFFLWHIAAGQHGFWDLKWEMVCDGLTKRHVNLSTILLDGCPIFTQVFSAVSTDSLRITPWFHTIPGLRFLLSGLSNSGAVPSMVSAAAHHAPSISVPSTMGVAVWVSPSELPANGTRDDQWAAPPFSQHAGSDVYARGLAMVPFLNPYGGPQASSSNAVQNQPHPSLDNVFVPESLGHARVDWPAPPHGSGAEQQQLTPHGYTERIDSRDDYADTVPMSSGSSDEMSDNEWTGTLNLNGKRIRARALMAGAIGDPKLSALPNDLEVEPAVGLTGNLTILDIQVWIRETGAPIVRLSYVDGNDDFDQLVEKIRAHHYAVVTWENRDRLLLAPLGKDLLCAAFPEKGPSNRPTPQQRRKIRTLPPRPRKEKNQKKESSQKKKKQKSGLGQRPQRYPPTTSKSSNGPHDESYPGSATQSTLPLLQPEPVAEIPQMSYLPHALESMQGEINPSSEWNLVDGSGHHQTTSPPLFPVEQRALIQAPRGALDTHGELVDRMMDTGAADCMADPPTGNLKPEAMDEMFEYVNFDGYQ